MSIVWKPIESAHATAWAELSNLLSDAAGVGDHYAPEDLAAELEEPGVDSLLDTLGAWDGATMVAYGQLRVAPGRREGVANAFLGGGVHPSWRGRGLGRAVMDWIEPRAAELARSRHPGAPGRLSLWAGAPGSGSARLAAARGYRPARHLHDLEVDLEAWRPPAQTDDAGRSPERGPAVSTRPLDVADRAIVEATRQAHNEAFADQPGSAERDAATWAAQLLASAFRPELSRVAVREAPVLPPGASVDSYVLSCEYAPGELYVSLVGTRRRARGRGLASRLLGEVLAAAKTAGYSSAALGVDADGPGDAVGLYERIGFRQLRTDVVYEKSFLGLAVRPSLAQLPGQPGRAGRRSRAGLAASA